MYAALAIITGGLITAFIVNFIFEHIFVRLVGRTKTDLDDKIIAELKPLTVIVVIIGSIYFALFPLSLSTNLYTLSHRAFLTLIQLIINITLVKIVSLVSKDLFVKFKHTHEEMLATALPFIENVLKFSVAGIVILAIMSIWGIDITPALASAGVAGVAFAFAAKDTVANLFGGLSVFFDKPYKIGDYVIIKDIYRGEVIEIGMRSTKIRTRDNVLLTVPNSVMVTDAVVNETGFDPRLRIRIPIGVAYGSDLEKVEKVVINAVKSHKEILEKPAPRMRYRRFGDSAIEFEILATIKEPAERGKIIHELIKIIDKRFKEKKIQIPFPQRDVHLYKIKS